MTGFISQKHKYKKNKYNIMSEILKKKLPTDLVRLIQSYLLPSIFDIYISRIELNNEIKNIVLDFKKENEIYDFYMNYYRGDVYISTMFLN
jgi:hypothetical protein